MCYVLEAGFFIEFMRINIETKNITITPAIESFVRERINSLEKFIKVLEDRKYSSPASGKEKPVGVAWVEIGKDTKHHKKGPFFRAECQLSFAGKRIRSEAISKDLRLAVTEVKDELQRKLKQQKDKIISKRRRSRRSF